MAKNSYTLRDLGPELTRLYSQYKDLTARLASGEISESAALRAVSELSVEDRYGGRWTIYPEDGSFILTSAQGARELNADPRLFQPKRSYSNDELLDAAITKSEVVDDAADDGAFAAEDRSGGVRKSFVVWGAIGGLILGLIGGAAGVIMLEASGSSDTPADVVQVVERPKLPEGAGPSADRVSVVLQQLSSGKAESIGFVVADKDDSDGLLWSATVFKLLGDSGHLMKEVRTADGISVLQVVNKDNRVVMQGDLEWTKASNNQWILAKFPVMAPVDTDAPPVQAVETPAPAASESSSPAEPESAAPSE